MPLFSTAPDSICILRLSAIGDVCNTIAAVQCIQRYWPETKITWITGKMEAQLLSAIDNIEVITFDKKGGLGSYKALWSQLKNRKFDALLHMQYALRASVATLGIKARYKLGFDKVRSQDFQTLFTNVKVPSPQSMHVLDGLLAFAQTLGVTDITPQWNLHYSDSDAKWALEQLDASKLNLVIVAGASKAYKNWTASGYAALIEHAHNKGWNVVLAGSPAQVEMELTTQILQLTNVKCNNVVGKSTLMQMLALIDKADVLVAPDTGPAHMANAMATPVIGLYAHHNPQRTGPYRYQQYIVSVYQQAIEQQTGKKVADLHWRTRVKDESAMNKIDPDSVIAMFDNVESDLFHSTSHNRKENK